MPTKKAANKEGFGKNDETFLVEWEKNQIKPLFKEFDKEKKGVNKEGLLEIIPRLVKDECIIGKVPAEEQIEEGFFENLFSEETKDDKLVTWEHFREFVVNMWPWKMVCRE